MVREIEMKKKSEENVQLGSLNRVDLTTGGEALGGLSGKWKGRKSQYCIVPGTWTLVKRQDDQLDAPTTYSV